MQAHNQTIVITNDSGLSFSDGDNQCHAFSNVMPKVESVIEGRDSPFVERKMHDTSLYSVAFLNEDKLELEFEESISLEELANPLKTCKIPYPHSSVSASRISGITVKSLGENTILVSSEETSYKITSAKVLQLQLLSHEGVTYIFSREENEDLQQSIELRKLAIGQSISVLKLPIPETVIHVIFRLTNSIFIEQIGMNYRLGYVKNDEPNSFFYSEKLTFYPWIVSLNGKIYCISQKQESLVLSSLSLELEKDRIFFHSFKVFDFSQNYRIETVTLTSEKLFVLYTEATKPLPKIFAYDWSSGKKEFTIQCKFVLLHDEPFKAEMIYSKHQLHVAYAALKTTLVAKPLGSQKPEMIERKAIAEIIVKINKSINTL